MYTRKRKPNWLAYCIVLMIILFICIGLIVRSKPIKVVNIECRDENGNLLNSTTAGAIEKVNSYLDPSLLGDTQINGVVVTECQQDFEAEPFEHCFELTEEESYLLAKLVECEAGNQSMEAKERVVMVVLNRVDDIRFPNTIEEVIKEEHNGVYQFSPLIPDGGNWYYTEPTDDSYIAIKNVQCLLGDEVYLWCDYLWFEALLPDEQNWHSESLEFAEQVGDIRFYR